MEKASGLFGKIVNELGLEDMMVVERVKGVWYVLFPRPLGVNMVPNFFKNGTLHLCVSSNLWLHELQSWKKDILQKLRPYGISEIRMKAGDIECLSEDDASADDTGCRVLCQADVDFIEETSNTLPEGPLKGAFKRTMEKAFTRTGGKG